MRDTSFFVKKTECEASREVEMDTKYDDRLKTEYELMTRIVERFVDLQEPFYPAVYKTFRELGAYLRADRILLMRSPREKALAVVETAWQRSEELRAQIKREGPAVEYLLTRVLAAGDKLITFQDVATEEALADLAELGLTSLVIVPVWDDGSQVHWLSFELCGDHRVPDEGECKLLTLIGKLVGSALLRDYQQEREGEESGLLDRVLDASPNGVVFFDEHYQPVDCNKSAPRLFGYQSREEFLAKYEEMVPEVAPLGEVSRTILVEQMKTAQRVGTSRFRLTGRRRDGQELPLGVTLVRIPWEQGHRLVAYVRDRRLESRHEQIRDYLDKQNRVMLDTTPLMIVLRDEEGHILDCNTECLRLLGLENKSQFINNYYDFVPPYQTDGVSTRERVREIVGQVQKEGQVSFDWQFIHGDGRLLPVHTHVFRVELGGEPRFIAYSKDLSELSQARREQQLAEQRAALMLDAMPVAAYLINRDYQIIDGNKHALELFGLGDKEEFKSVFFSGLSPEYQEDGSKSLDLAHQAIDEAFAKGKANFKWLHRRRDGGLFPCDIQLQRVAAAEDEGFLAAYAAPILQNARPLEKNVPGIQMNNRELIKKQSLLTAINDIAELIMVTDNDQLPFITGRCLAMIGESLGVERVGLWQNYEDEDGRLFSARQGRWVSCECENAGESKVKLDLYEYIPAWRPGEKPVDLEVRGAGDFGPFAQMIQCAEEKVILLTPLILEDKFWGFIALVHGDRRYHFTPEEWAIVRSGGLMIAESVTRSQISASLLQVEAVAAADYLTGLLNRCAFLPQATLLFEKCKRVQANYSVLFLDLDYFKKINDHYGHIFGDKVLVVFAEALNAAIRPKDLCARYGGEEFLIVLAEGTARDARSVAQRIEEKVSQIHFEEYPEFKLTVSIGIHSAVPKAGDDLDDVIKKADKALYQAKVGGRNQIVEYSEMTGEADDEA